MTTSSYLFMRNQKEKPLSREMEKQSITDSNISMDSLEEDFNRKASVQDSASDENVETILVPFYEKDVLIKVPKDQIRKGKPDKTRFTDKFKKDSQHASSYLVNKDIQKIKRTTYLEMFRKQFVEKRAEKKQINPEIRSISPEVGDTERESFGEDPSNQGDEFYNTESYNEIYYEKLLHQQLEDYLDDSSEEGLLLNEDLESKSPNCNLRSVSEVSQPRRHARRATVPPSDNMKIGGLGPDVEMIKPRLERARSLQRYSEKVRMANRLRIYKKSVQDDNKKKESLTQRDSARKIPSKNQGEENASYLVKKPSEEKSANLIRHIYDSKSKSATLQKTKERYVRKEDQTKAQSASKKNASAVEKQKFSNRDMRSKITNRREEAEVNDDAVNLRVKSSARSRTIHTEIKPVGSEIPPVHISFLVNLGGVRPSSALRSLEEKHRHYQEQVKAYMNNND